MSQTTVHNIQLISNASMSVYPSNKPQNFTNVLFNTLELDGTHEAGITEFIYPNNFMNVKQDCIIQLLVDVKTKPSSGVVRSLLPLIRIPKGYYDSIKKLCSVIEEEINKVLDIWAKQINAVLDPNILVTYNPTSQRVSFELLNVDKAIITIKREVEIFRFLGFETAINVNIELPAEGTKQATIKMHSPCIFVYCSIIEPQLVGDTAAQVLRIIPIQGENQEIMWERFVDPSYIKLNTGYINSITIKLCSDSGDEIPFEAGKVIISLRIRKCGIE